MRRGGFQRDRLAQLPARRRVSAGIRPLVTFEHSAGGAGVCRKPACAGTGASAGCRSAPDLRARPAPLLPRLPVGPSRSRPGTRPTTTRSRRAANPPPRRASPTRAPRLPALHDRARRRARRRPTGHRTRAVSPRYSGHARLDPPLPAARSRSRAGLRPPQLLGRQPLPPTGTRALVPALSVAARSGSPKPAPSTTSARSAQRAPPDARDALDVPRRPQLAADQAPLRLHLVRRR